MGLALPSSGSRPQRRGTAPTMEEPMWLGKNGAGWPIVGVRVAGMDILFSGVLGQRVPVGRGLLDRRGLLAHSGGRDLRFG